VMMRQLDINPGLLFMVCCLWFVVYGCCRALSLLMNLSR
jgi:hypothetical protein